MKQATQTAIDRLMNRIPPGISEGHAASLRELIEYELREQDKRTRHACAEAVLSNDNDSTMAPAVLARAHDACINTQSI